VETPPLASETTRKWRLPLRRDRRVESCLNCGTPVERNYCPECGQENLDANVPISYLIRDLWDDLVKIDSRFIRTLIPLLIRPGFLTAEYAQGRRMRYVPPLKIYLVCSFLLFLVAPTVSNRVGRVSTTSTEASGQIKTQSRSLGSEETIIDMGTANAKVENLFQAFVIDRVSRLDGQDGRKVIDKVWEKLPTAMFFMLPLFAGLIYALNAFRPGYFYVQHLVFSLHCHAYYFLVFTLAVLTPPPWAVFDGLVVASVPIYSLVALRRFYNRNWLKTLFKAWVLLLGYVTILTFVILGALLVAAGELPDAPAKPPASGKVKP